MSASKPFCFLQVVPLSREDHRLHSIIEQGISLHKIHNVYCDLLIFSGIRNGKEEPLSIPLGVYIVLKNKVIFIVVGCSFKSCKEITRFKFGIELQFLLLLLRFSMHKLRFLWVHPIRYLRVLISRTLLP